MCLARIVYKVDELPKVLAVLQDALKTRADAGMALRLLILGGLSWTYEEHTKPFEEYVERVEVRSDRS